MNEQAPRPYLAPGEESPAESDQTTSEAVSGAEMPADFVEPEGKSGGWDAVVENEELGVRYREKTIELPKHRQEETGVKRIRRREMLPPFPEGLIGQTEKGITYNTNNDKSLDEQYKYLTDGIYPSMRILTHVLDWNFARLKDDFFVKERVGKDIERFKREGLYFQEVYSPKLEPETKKDRIPFVDTELSLSLGPYFSGKYSTPMFIFGDRNRAFVDYLNSVKKKEFILKWLSGKYDEKNYRGVEIILDVKSGPDIKPLRWCHAELALVPTKRSLNVLFFETE